MHTHIFCNIVIQMEKGDLRFKSPISEYMKGINI